MPSTSTSPLPPAPGAASAPIPPRPLERARFTIRLSAGENREFAGVETVTVVDFSDAVAETWRESQLRKGCMENSPDHHRVEILPILENDSGLRCHGFALTMPGPDGASERSVFSLHSLDFVARRGFARLVANGTVNKDDPYFYELICDRAPAPALPDAGDVDADIFGTTFEQSRPPLHYLSAPLQSLLDRSTAVPLPAGQTGTKDPFPVFLTEKAYALSEEFSRKGAELNPFFESGAVLAGSLGSCSDTGELFAVVYEVFEVTDADQSLVSLEYSAASWKRIQTVIRARQKSQPSFRLLGQAHGHNFLPNEGKTCEACPTREYCDLTNLFASADDRDWTRATFAVQPWALCGIFGLSARGDQINGLFSPDGGQLALREFRLLPDFNPDDFPTKSTPV